MAQARTSLLSTINYSRSNSASLVQGDHGAKIPVYNKGAFITDRQQASASSTTADEEVGSEVHVPSEPDADYEELVPSQPVPRTSRSGDGQSSELLGGGHSEWPSGSAPLRTGADPAPRSSGGLSLPSYLSEATYERESLVIGYPILVPAELGDTVWEHGVNEEDIFLPRADHSFCNEGYWSFLCSTAPNSRPSEVNSHIQEEPSTVRVQDFEFALVLEYERERCLNRFADGVSYASVLEKNFGMDMNWTAPQMSIRKRASEPFIFPDQRLQEGCVAASTSFSAHNPAASRSIGIVDVVKDRRAAGPSHDPTKTVLERGRSQSPKMLRDHMQSGTGEGSRQQEGSRRPPSQKSIRHPPSSKSPSRASPERQATVSGEEFRDVICAAAAPPAEVDFYASSYESSPACSHSSSPVRSSSRSSSRFSCSSASSYVPSDAEGLSGASRKRKQKQRPRPQAVKGNKAPLQDSIPSPAVGGAKRKRATLASRQPPSTRTNVNPASTAVPDRPKAYAVDRGGDINCPWPDCSHSASVLQMRDHLSQNHRRDSSFCYWPGCQANRFSSAARHIDDRHLNIEWICPACNSTFKSERSADRHISKSCEAWQRVDIEEVKENRTSDDNGQRSTQSELKSSRNERAVDERPTKRRKT